MGEAALLTLREGDSPITVLSVESQQQDMCLLIRHHGGYAIVLPSCVLGTPDENTMIEAARARITPDGHA
jgi:hypothetical protein